MSKPLIAVLSILVGILLCVGIFFLTVFIASKVNVVSFYEQIRLWFGNGTWFANLFKG